MDTISHSKRGSHIAAMISILGNPELSPLDMAYVAFPAAASIAPPPPHRATGAHAFETALHNLEDRLGDDACSFHRTIVSRAPCNARHRQYCHTHNSKGTRPSGSGTIHACIDTASRYYGYLLLHGLRTGSFL